MENRFCFDVLPTELNDIPAPPESVVHVTDADLTRSAIATRNKLENEVNEYLSKFQWTDDYRTMSPDFIIPRTKHTFTKASWRRPQLIPKNKDFILTYRDRYTCFCRQPSPIVTMVRSERDENRYQIYPDASTVRYVNLASEGSQKCTAPRPGESQGPRAL